MEPEQIIPRIYYTANEQDWTAERIRHHNFTHIIRIDRHHAKQQPVADHNANLTEAATDPIDLATLATVLDLDFGANPNLTTVLPCCYSSVQFIDRAMRWGGSVLIVGRQDNAKAIVIVVGYLMFKDHLKFR